MTEHEKRILEEEHLNGIKMTNEEKHKYLDIIKKCKDISNTIYPVDNVTCGNVVEITFINENNCISFNGSVNYSSKNKSENRTINGYIYLDNDKTVVDMFVTRLCVKENNTYSVVDEFKDNEIKSFYNTDINHNYIKKENIK